MKKWIIVVVVAGLIGAVWYYVRTYVRYTPVWFQPKFGTVTKGDISVPIVASGLIEPKQRIEVKSKASGEVIECKVEEGAFVQPGQVLVVLKQDDERRRLDSAEASLQRAEALLEQARLAKDRAGVNITTAEADVERLKAQCAVSDFEFDKIKKYIGEGENPYASQEYVNAEAQHKMNLASLEAAKAQQQIAVIALADAKEAVKLQQAAVSIAKTDRDDAQERFDETTIKSKYAALVTDVRVRVSEMIQSGTASLTGGTVVMYLADVSKKEVVARVDEADYGRVLNISPVDALPDMPGLQESIATNAQEMERRSGIVRLTVDAFPEDTFEGRIERVEPQGRLNQGAAIIQYNVHVAITDKRANILPLGAQAQVEFTVESAKNALRVPADAVKSYQSDRGVWVQAPPEPGSGDKYGKKFIPCRFGITDGEYTQVIEVKGDAKLEANMKVYTQLPVNREELEK